MGSHEEPFDDVTLEDLAASLAQADQILGGMMPDDKGMPEALQMKGVCLAAIFIKTNDLAYLHAARTALIKAASLSDRRNPVFVSILSGLANIYDGFTEHEPPSAQLLEEQAATLRILLTVMDDSQVPATAARLGRALGTLLRMRPDDKDLLHECRAAWERSLEPVPSDLVSRSERQVALARTLVVLAGSGNAAPADIQEALDLIGQLQAGGFRHPAITALTRVKPFLLSALAGATQDYRLAEEAFSTLRRGASDESDQGVWTKLSSYAIQMLTFASSLEEFDRAESALQAVYSKLDPSSSGWARLVSEYAQGVFTHATVTPRFEKLIRMLRGSLARCDPGTARWGMIAWYLAVALQLNYDQNGNIGDLLEATQIQRKVMPICTGKTWRLKATVAFSGMLGEWYSLTDEAAALREAIEILKPAAASAAEDDPDLAPALSNLTALMLRSRDEDAVNALHVVRRALAICPADHPERPGVILNFAEALMRSAESADKHALRTEAVPLLEKLLLSSGPPGTRMMRARCHQSLARALLSIADKEPTDVAILQRASDHARLARDMSDPQAPLGVELTALDAQATRRLAEARGDGESLQQALGRCRDLTTDPGLALHARFRAGEEWMDLAKVLGDEAVLAAACSELLSLGEQLLAHADTQTEYESTRRSMYGLNDELFRLAAESQSVSHISLLARAIRAHRSNRHISTASSRTTQAAKAPGQPGEDR